MSTRTTTIGLAVAVVLGGLLLALGVSSALRPSTAVQQVPVIQPTATDLPRVTHAQYGAPLSRWIASYGRPVKQTSDGYVEWVTSPSNERIVVAFTANQAAFIEAFGMWSRADAEKACEPFLPWDALLLATVGHYTYWQTPWGELSLYGSDGTCYLYATDGSQLS